MRNSPGSKPITVSGELDRLMRTFPKEGFDRKAFIVMSSRKTTEKPKHSRVPVAGAKAHDVAPGGFNRLREF